MSYPSNENNCVIFFKIHLWDSLNVRKAIRREQAQVSVVAMNPDALKKQRRGDFVPDELSAAILADSSD
jgi:hypothetical protein